MALPVIHVLIGQDDPEPDFSSVTDEFVVHLRRSGDPGYSVKQFERFRGIGVKDRSSEWIHMDMCGCP